MTEHNESKSKGRRSTFVRGEDYIEGTIADLIGRGEESRLRINGKPVSQPDLSTLTRLNIAVSVGVAERPEGKRGPAPAIVRIPTNIPGLTVARR